MNNIQDYIGIAQTGAISFAFVFLTVSLVVKGPGLWTAWLASREKLATIEAERESKRQQFESDEREKDRQARHTAVTQFGEINAKLVFANRDALATMTAAIADLRVTSERICRYQSHHEQTHP